MPTDRLFRTHVFVPHTGQFVINELPILVLCCAGWVFGGIDGLPFTTLSMWVALLLSLFLVYRFIYLRRIRYRIGSEQLVCEHGIIWRKTDYMELYPYRGLHGKSKPAAAALRAEDGEHFLDGPEYPQA